MKLFGWTKKEKAVSLLEEQLADLQNENDLLLDQVESLKLDREELEQERQLFQKRLLASQKEKRKEAFAAFFAGLALALVIATAVHGASWDWLLMLVPAAVMLAFVLKGENHD
ncbi:hypothetical protein PT274_03920 [Leuconostocaceae bacterium ESL0958]|nr:hypothetical protein [Leuconostocaceae bacterium ESL0958]